MFVLLKLAKVILQNKMLAVASNFSFNLDHKKIELALQLRATRERREGTANTRKLKFTRTFGGEEAQYCRVLGCAVLTKLLTARA